MMNGFNYTHAARTTVRYGCASKFHGRLLQREDAWEAIFEKFTYINTNMTILANIVRDPKISLGLGK